jgi:GT2 family glycosyltransferase
MSEVAACVMNRNGESVLAGTLEALLAEGSRFSEIFVVDDASTDGSLALVRGRFPDIRILPLAGNLGPAHGRNVGFAAARAKRVLFVDNDVRITPGSARLLMRALDENPRAAIAMPRVLLAHDPSRIQYDGAESHFLGVMVPSHEGKRAAEMPPETRTIRSLITACFLVDRSRWGEPALFDPSFFIYQEDHDLGYRACLAGLEVLAVGGATCLHGMGTEGLSLRRGGRYSPLRVRSLIRNRWLVILRNYSARTILLLLPALLLYEIAQMAAALRKGWFGIWIRSVSWLIARSGTIARERRRIQSTRRVRDRAILTGGPLPLRSEVVEGRTERAARRVLDACFAAYYRAVGPVL